MVLLLKGGYAQGVFYVGANDVSLSHYLLRIWAQSQPASWFSRHPLLLPELNLVLQKPLSDCTG